MRYMIRFLGQHCTVDTDIDLIERLGFILTPFMTIEDTGNISDSGVHFDLVRNPAAVKEYANIPCSNQKIELHCDLTGHVIANEKNTVICVNELDVVYLLEQKEGQLYFKYFCNELTNEVLLDFLRIVRGSLIGLAESSGLVKAHMAIAEYEGLGVAFIGGEGAGKTSFLLSFLAQFNNTKLITNDKALLGLSSDHKLDAYGLPYAVSIGEGTLAQCPTIQATVDTRIINNEAYFWPIEIAEQMNRLLQRQVEIAVVFHVQIDPAQDHLTCTEVNDLTRKREIIENHVLNFSDRISPYWMKKWINTGPIPQDDIVQQLIKKPAYTLKGNPWRRNLKLLLESHKDLLKPV